jgi:hypothetical protein
MAPFLLRTASALNSFTLVRLVLAVRLTWMSEPRVAPTAARELLATRAALTWAGLTFSAAMRSGLSHTRMAKVRAPRMSARCTPCSADRRVCTARTRYSVIWFCARTSEVKLR